MGDFAAVRCSPERVKPVALQALAALLASGSCGCLSGSLATTTGDRADGAWSAARRQRVHVGETVSFSFVLKHPFRQKAINAIGLADYCVFLIGNARVEADINETGGFTTEHTFSRAAEGDTITVKARAYRQRGDRDFKRIAGVWLQNASPLNEPDKIVARDNVRLTTYQTNVRIALPRLADDFDFSTARLLLLRSDGHRAAVYQHRPPRRGFELVKRTSEAGWWVCYEPAGNEVNPSGTTDVEFSVYDLAGNRHRFTGTVKTP